MHASVRRCSQTRPTRWPELKYVAFFLFCACLCECCAFAVSERPTPTSSTTSETSHARMSAWDSIGWLCGLNGLDRTDRASLCSAAVTHANPLVSMPIFRSFCQRSDRDEDSLHPDGPLRRGGAPGARGGQGAARERSQGGQQRRRSTNKSERNLASPAPLNADCVNRPHSLILFCRILLCFSLRPSRTSPWTRFSARMSRLCGPTPRSRRRSATPPSTS